MKTNADKTRFSIPVNEVMEIHNQGHHLFVCKSFCIIVSSIASTPLTAASSQTDYLLNMTLKHHEHRYCPHLSTYCKVKNTNFVIVSTTVCVKTGRIFSQTQDLCQTAKVNEDRYQMCVCEMSLLISLPLSPSECHRCQCGFHQIHYQH